MPAPELQTVRALIEPFAGELDVAEAIDDPALQAATGELIAEDAPIEFTTPEGGIMGGMGGPFRGPDGYLAGWREWVAPWAELRVEIERTRDLGDGRVLVEAELVARIPGSSTPFAQPGAALYDVRDGRIVRIEHFLDRAQARRAAGLG